MQLITFKHNNVSRIGVIDHDAEAVVDLMQAVPGLPNDMLSLIALGEEALIEVRYVVASGNARLPLNEVQVKAPIPRPIRNVFCVGKNYRDHVDEVKLVVSPAGDDASIPDHPIFFTKATTAVIGPGKKIPASSDPTNSVDYEGELAVIIGQGGHAISRDQAMKHVYGYSIINDVTSRRLQKSHQQWFLGKSLDGFCPLGPSIVTHDAISDVSKLRVQTYVNNELRQDGLVADMIFDIPTLIETLSASITLESGDIIATGTPAGVGMGFKPPRFLQPGDHVAVSILPIGTLENSVA